MSNTRLGKILKTKFESVSSVIKPRVGLIFNFDWDGPSLVAIEKISSDSITLNRLSTAKPVDENTNYLPKDELEDVNTGKAVKASDVKVGRVYSCDWDGQSIVAVKSIDGDDVEVVRLRKVKSDEDTLVVDKDEVLEELGFIKGDVIEFKFGNRSKFESAYSKLSDDEKEDKTSLVLNTLKETKLWTKYTRNSSKSRKELVIVSLGEWERDPSNRENFNLTDKSVKLLNSTIRELNKTDEDGVEISWTNDTNQYITFHFN